LVSNTCTYLPPSISVCASVSNPVNRTDGECAEVTEGFATSHCTVKMIRDNMWDEAMHGLPAVELKRTCALKDDPFVSGERVHGRCLVIWVMEEAVVAQIIHE
jgi:hypothetical protein